jgi:ATP-dependent exoDNAse (exonuclease V) beta subunit
VPHRRPRSPGAGGGFVFPELNGVAQEDTVVADRRARELASDPQRSVILQAPAGSGKTTVLTQRLLRLLAEVDEPEEILAITFTRKAAAEMRARVMGALRADPQAAGSEHLREVAAAALERSARRGWNLPEDPARLSIQTIDSFNFRLASQLPISARAGGSLLVSDRPRELYHSAARQTLRAAEADAALGADVERLFERLDNRWSHVETLLAEMLEERAHWLRHVLAHEPEALCERIEESLLRITRDQLAAASSVWPPSLRAKAGALPGAQPLSDDPGSLEAWKRLAVLLLTGQGHWRQVIGRSLGPEYEDPAAREALRSCIELARGIAGARECLLEFRALPAFTLGSEDAAALAALSRVLKVAAVHLQAQLALAGRVDHTYVTGAARAALLDAGSPTDLGLRIGLSLRHILVDELQDISVAQLELLEALTVGWEEGDGRTLFAVGDPMQSIYQFREAEVGLFLRARDHGIGPVRMTPLTLTRNFRSIPALIGWSNEIFARLFPRNDDLRASAVAFTPSVPGRQDDAGSSDVPVHLSLFADPAAEAAWMAERIRALRQADSAATIAVLVAARTHAGPVVAALEAAGIAAIGVDLTPLAELSIIRDLVVLTRALHDLSDRTAWLAVLRAPWCGLSLAALTVLAERPDSQVIWDALQNPVQVAECAPADRDRISRVQAVLAEALVTRDRGDLADWLERTWLKLGAADAYPSPALAHARVFLAELAEAAGNGEWRGPQDLDRLLADLYAQPVAPRGSPPKDTASEGAPVQIMTIHRAKGLEFDHVLLPALDRDLARGREPLLRWLDLPRPISESDLIMAPIPAISDEEAGEVGRYLKRLIQRRVAHEQVRLLYVAVTRARSSLCLSATPRIREGAVAPRAGTLLAWLWPVLGSAFARDDRAALQAPTASAAALRRLLSPWTPPLLAAALPVDRVAVAQQSLEPPEFSWVGETSRHVGTVVHAALQAFAQSQTLPEVSAIESRRDDYLHQLRQQGVPSSELPRATDRVLDALVRTVTDQRGRWILDASHGQAASELALTGIAGGVLRSVVIDRSFVDSGTRWVIDFKTSGHEGGAREAFLDQEMQRYRAQLETYRALARGLGPEPVKAALYFPLLRAFRELS